MSRPPRDKKAGVFHAVTHSIRDEALFRSDRDRVHFLRELARAKARSGWTCVVYCLMTTHYHVILEVEDEALPRGMHRLNFRYASWFNSEYGFRGHVMAARYWSRRINDNADLLGTYRYVVMNPVRAKECTSPIDWPWSSYAGTAGLRPADDFVDPTLVLGCFDGPLELRRADLRRYVEGS